MIGQDNGRANRDSLVDSKNSNSVEGFQKIKDQTKSCQLQKIKKIKNINANIDHQLHSYKGYQLVSIKSINKIFDDPWHNQAKGKKGDIDIFHKKQINQFLKKNQQIAESLMKQRKSMSQLVYNTGKQSQFLKYQNEINLKKAYIQQTKQVIKNLKSKTPQTLPKINSHGRQDTINAASDQQQEQNVVQSHSKGSLQQCKKIQDNKIFKNLGQKSCSEIGSKKIKHFLKLKQHAYEENHKNYQRKSFKGSLQHTALLKKKNKNDKKNFIKRNSEKIKNSLQDYLQTKAAPSQQKIQSLRVSLKCNLERINSLQKLNDKKLINLGSTQTKQQNQCEAKYVNENFNNIHLQKLQSQPSVPQMKLILKKQKKPNLIINGSFPSKKILLQTVDSQLTVYQQKISNFRQFLFFVNLSHNIFNPIRLGQQGNTKNQNKYKFYVGIGNNSQLVRSLMKRRFWWVQTADISQAQFIWTQLKINQIFQTQPKLVKSQLKSKLQNENGEEQIWQQHKNGKKGQNKLNIIKNSYTYKAPLPLDPLRKIFSIQQINSYSNAIKFLKLKKNIQKQQNFEMIRKLLLNLQKKEEDIKQLKVHNHFQFNYYIGNKKALFYNLKQYCKLMRKNVFEIVPLTFHIGEEGVNDPVYKQFIEHYKANRSNGESRNIWIIKPGQNSNRGNGIEVSDELYQINRLINKSVKSAQKGLKTLIIQKYIERPLLYKGRKFDIRHYMMATKMHGRMKLYFYSEGYVRTSSSMFDLTEVGDTEIHLTNDAIQKFSQCYGKYQEGNKISYSELQRYIDSTFPTRKYSIANEFYPRIKQIALDTFKACYLAMDPNNLAHNFQIFGLDFMIDTNFNVWLIEVNTNPCLQLSSSLLNRVIPTMLEHSFRLTIDPLFPPPCHYMNSVKHLVPDNALERLQYQLIFDELTDGKTIQALYKNIQKVQGLEGVQEDQDTFDNDGKQIDIQIQ